MGKSGGESSSVGALSMGSGDTILISPRRPPYRLIHAPQGVAAGRGNVELTNFRQVAGERTIKVHPMVGRLIEPAVLERMRGGAAEGREVPVTSEV